MKKILLLFSIIASMFIFAQQDCVTAIPICGNSQISYTPTGFGVQEINTPPGCGFQERYSVWYSFTIQTAGTLTFVITPNAVTDYDFYLYGPNVTCATKGNPIRCSTPYTPAGTGLNMTSTILNEPVGGGGNPTGFARYLDVLPGQTYFLCVNNYSQNTNGFTLNFGGTALLESPFNPGSQPFPFIAPPPVKICANPTLFNFQTLTSGILNGNTNFIVSYYSTINNAIAGTSPITTPTNVNAPSTYYYRIQSTLPNSSCFQTGTITFQNGTITTTDQTIQGCEINGSAIFNLTTANVFTSGSIVFTKKYYPTLADANAGTNEILLPQAQAYNVAAGFAYVKVTTDYGCSSIAKVTLQYGPKLPLNTPTDQFICDDNLDGTTSVNIASFASLFTVDPLATTTYFPTQADAYANTNAITNTNVTFTGTQKYYLRFEKAGICVNFGILTVIVKTSVLQLKETHICDDDLDGIKSVDIASFTNLFTTDLAVTTTFYATQSNAFTATNPLPTTVVSISGTNKYYLRFEKAGQCVTFGVLTIFVDVPKKSDVLKDVYSCIDAKAVLNAGPGFTAYLWSTGAVSTSITAPVGEYWVDLTFNGCVYRQYAKIIANPDPVISQILIENNTISVVVTGGNPPYEYSLNNISWQTSNVFHNVPRGLNTVYVRTADNCLPVSQEFTMINLVNAITPNGDGINDVLDYSALSYKENVTFSIYDRYGSKMFTGDVKNGYTWDGKFFNRNIPTGTYWYVITWNETDASKTPVKYSGWIMIKNRD